MQCELELYLEPVSVLNVAAELIEDEYDMADVPSEHEQVRELSPYSTDAADSALEETCLHRAPR